MRSGGSKSKGSAFERDCCRDLSSWISSGKDQDCFWRSALSGGRSTVALKSGKNLAKQAGDISATSEIGHKLTNKFLFECKFYSDLQLENLFYNDEKGKFIQFWKRLVADSTTYKKLPFIIAKQNRSETLAGFNHDGYALFNLNEIRHTQFTSLDLVLVSFQDFLEKIKPDVLF